MFKSKTKSKTNYNVKVEQDLQLSNDDWNFIRIDIESITNNTFKQLKKLVKEKYKSDPNCVYKMCETRCNSYLVVLQKLADTITNESRENVINPDFAKFRSNGLLVRQIIRLRDMNPNITHINHRTIYENKFSKKCKKYTKYYVHCMVFPDVFCSDIKLVSAGGIHYYKTLQAAFFQQKQIPWYSNYNGLWFECDGDGGNHIIKEYNGGMIIRAYNSEKDQNKLVKSSPSVWSHHMWQFFLNDDCTHIEIAEQVA